jgi:hypothetical protein
MTSESPAVLERLLRGNDLGWMIDMFAPRDRAIPHLLTQLDQVAKEYLKRFPAIESFTPEGLELEAQKNSHKVRAFLQAMGITRSADMLVMVWRILQGLSIREVVMNYREQEAFRLVVILARPGEEGDELEEYRSTDINDAALVRHFGITTVDGRPLFDGFFPMRERGKAESRA